MRTDVERVARRLAATACLAAACLAGLWGTPLLGAPGGVRPLSDREMREAVGLANDLTCSPDGSSCADTANDACPSCTRCSNQASGGGTCVSQPYATCTSSSLSCGDQIQGGCCDTCGNGCSQCNYDDPIVSGSCGSLNTCS